MKVYIICFYLNRKPIKYLIYIDDIYEKIEYLSTLGEFTSANVYNEKNKKFMMQIKKQMYKSNKNTTIATVIKKPKT